jgi:hypothetical protein
MSTAVQNLNEAIAAQKAALAEQERLRENEQRKLPSLAQGLKKHQQEAEDLAKQIDKYKRYADLGEVVVIDKLRSVRERHTAAINQCVSHQNAINDRHRLIATYDVRIAELKARKIDQLDEQELADIHAEIAAERAAANRNGTAHVAEAVRVVQQAAEENEKRRKLFGLI